MRLILLVLTLTPAADGAEPRAVIERAIKAHGGADKLDRLRQSREQTRGTLHAAGRQAEFHTETLSRLPGHFRSTITSDLRGVKLDLVQVLDGERGWVNERGLTRPADAATVADWKEHAHAAYLATLTPLLAGDKGYRLTALGNHKVNRRPAVGVKVAVKGRRDVRLYFDAETGLLVQKSFQAREGGKAGEQDEVYGEFKDFDGLKRPTHIVIRRDGTIHADVRLAGLRLLGRVDDEEFAKPQ